MVERLVIVAGTSVMGEIHRDARGRLTLVYDEAWRQGHEAYPLSLSLPLVLSEHGHATTESWLWGLLPDSEPVLARWGQRFQVSPRNVFALLAAVGEDCAGAAQIVQPQVLDTYLKTDSDTIVWLTEHDVAERLRLLRQDHAAWRLPRDGGQFSLAGAQPKIALFFDGERWGLPSGRLPTTHILKPPTGVLDGHAENEHFCLMLARTLGLPAARSEVRLFEDQQAIVVERYDRVRIDGQLRRLHQEDMCQALGMRPTKKYQNEGGPSAGAIAELIRLQSSRPEEDVRTFVLSIALNWLIGGTDAHAKNYSMLIGSGGQARLAPLYDVASSLPYDTDTQKLRLAMKIGGTYSLADIGRRHWTKLAAEVRLPAKEILVRCIDLAERLPAAATLVAQKVEAERLFHPIIDRLVALMGTRAANSVRQLSHSEAVQGSPESVR